MVSESDVPSSTSMSDIPSSQSDVPSSESDTPASQSEVLSWSSQSDFPSSSFKSERDGEPDPKRAKLDEEVEEVEEEFEGWDTWGEDEHLVYTWQFNHTKNPHPDAIAWCQFLEEHVRKNKGFNITARCAYDGIYEVFKLVLPHDAPIPEELKDIPNFPRIPPHHRDRALQHVNALAKCAVDCQNEKMGSKLEFFKVLKAYHHFNFWGYFFYITLVALDKLTGKYRKCQTRVVTSMRMCVLAPTIPYGVCSFWVRGEVDAAGAAKPDYSQLWPSDWELIRLREDEMPRIPAIVRHHS